MQIEESLARRVLISAHRGGCGRVREEENTLAAFSRAIEAGSDYIEFDIQRTADGEFVLMHDDHITINGRRVPVHMLAAATLDDVLGPRVRYADALVLLAQAGRKAHLDFKFTSPPYAYLDPATTFEVAAVQMALAHLPADGFIVTTTEDASVRTVRDWADATDLPLSVGLSIGRHRLTGMGWTQAARWRVEEMFPARRIRTSRANLVVAQRHLARIRLLAWAHRNNLPVLVWTVDNAEEMRRLLADPRVWMVTSNYPERGLALRSPA